MVQLNADPSQLYTRYIVIVNSCKIMRLLHVISIKKGVETTSIEYGSTEYLI